MPWALLKPTAGDPKTLTLNVDKNQFASANKFYLNHWPDSNEATWAPGVYSYYGLDYGTAGFGVGATGVGIQSDTGTVRSYNDMSKYGPVRSDGTPIDNGTAPDGKGTFVRSPRY